MRSRVRHRASSSICREATPFQRPWSVTGFHMTPLKGLTCLLDGLDFT